MASNICQSLLSGDANSSGDDTSGGGKCQWTPGGHGPVACAAERIGVGVLAKADRERLRFLAAGP